MSRVNVSEASREELVEIVKQLRNQLRQQNEVSQRIKELEQQTSRLKKELTAKEEAVKALTHQNAMLSEKLAEDEETISALIKQLEERMESDSASHARGEDGVLWAHTTSPQTQTQAPPELHKGSPIRGSPNPAPRRGSTPHTLGVTVGTLGEAGPNAATTIARKNEEIANLEAQVRELMEVNTFYTAIVSQHDEEERNREAAARSKIADAAKEPSPLEMDRLRARVGALENERDTLQRAVRQRTRENEVLEDELHAMREELTRTELDLVAAERWRAAAEVHVEAPQTHLSGAHVDTWRAFPQTPDGWMDPHARPTRTPAEPVAPIAYRGGGTSGAKLSIGRPRGWSTPSPVTESAPRHTTWRSLLDLAALPEIRMWNPSKQEKLLSERLELFQKYMEEMQAYELDRQRSFDEMERARAELFAGMNERLEEQRREIQKLRKRIAATSKTESSHTESQHYLGDVSLKPRTTTRVDAATSPVEALHCADTWIPPTATTGLVQVTREREKHEMAQQQQQQRQKQQQLVSHDSEVELLQELEQSSHCGGVLPEERHHVEARSVSPSSCSTIVEEETKDEAGEEKEENKDQPDALREEEENSVGSTSMNVSPRWLEILELTEVRERLSIVVQEVEEVTQLLAWSRAAVTVALTNLHNTTTALSATINTLSSRERVLAAKVAGLQAALADTHAESEKAETVKSTVDTNLQHWIDHIMEVFGKQKQWGSIHIICEAYEELVEAQNHVLRTIVSGPAHADAEVLCDDCKHVIRALDTVLIKQEAMRNLGKKDSTSDQMPTATNVQQASEEETVLPGVFRHEKTLSTPTHANDDNREDADDVVTLRSGTTKSIGGDTSHVEDSPQKVLPTPNLESGFCQLIQVVQTDEGIGDKKRDPHKPSKTEHDEQSWWNTPTASFFANPDAQQDVGSKDTTHAGSTTPTAFNEDSINLFTSTSLGSAGRERYDGTEKGPLPPVMANLRALDFFSTAPRETPSAKSTEQSQQFVAEFDPFA